MQRLRTRLRAGASTFPSATFALNFLTGGLDPAVTFTRSTTATFTGSNGLIQTAAINAPRFDYDPVTLAAKGLLLEEQRTNLLLQSETFDSGTWSKFQATITANATASPDGTADADALVEDANTGTHFCQQFFTFANATAYTMSAYVKAGTRAWCTLLFPSAAFGSSIGSYFNLSGAGALGTAIGSPTSRSITAVGNGWYRVTITATATAAAGGNLPISAASANNTNSYTGVNGTTAISIWGAQLEAGAFATSYIPTVASQVTRSADVATMTGTNFSSWYNPTEGTVVANFDTYAPSVADGFGRVYQIDDATNNNVIALQKNNGGGSQFFGYVAVSGAGQATLFTSAISANTPAKVATAYKLNDFGQATNGGTLVADASGTIPIVSQMRIGSLSGVSSLNGHVRQIAYYNTGLPNATLQALTA